MTTSGSGERITSGALASASCSARLASFGRGVVAEPDVDLEPRRHRRLGVVQDRVLRHHAVGHDDELPRPWSGAWWRATSPPAPCPRARRRGSSGRRGTASRSGWPGRQRGCRACPAARSPTTTAPTAEVVSSFSSSSSVAAIAKSAMTMTSCTMAGTRSEAPICAPRIERAARRRARAPAATSEQPRQPATQHRIAPGRGRRRLRSAGGADQQHGRERQPRAHEPAAHGGQRRQHDAQRDDGDEGQLHLRGSCQRRRALGCGL